MFCAEKGRSSLHFIARASAPTNNYKVIFALNYSYISLPYMEIPFGSFLFFSYTSSQSITIDPLHHSQWSHCI